MRASRSFTVRPQLPERLRELQELALNLRWSWHRPTRELFRELEPGVDDVEDPVRLLHRAGRRRLEELAADDAYVARVRRASADLAAVLERPRWFQGLESPLRAVAYFSPEFGIAEALPQYSGGLGVLAGDHLKEASELGVPIVGVGLLYHQGYFRQELSEDGWQQERYVDLDPHAMAMTPVEGGQITVDLAGTPLVAQIWQVRVGRVTLLLLDANTDENDVDCRRVTDRLYGGNTEHRLCQEILLGIGGVRALDKVGIPAQVFHTNEGHAGFLGLERIRRCVVEEGLSFAEAVEVMRSSTVFTTHTPVPAGIDLFPRSLMAKYFTSWAEECGVDFDALMALGHEPEDVDDAPFNMAVMGLRLAARSNAVSRLHGTVSRRMFAHLWPGVTLDEVPIGSVTNGIHARSWVAPAMADLFETHVGPDWMEAGADEWRQVDGIDDETLWKVRGDGRAQLVEFARRRVHDAAVGRGTSEADLSWIEELLDPDVLTIGYARRFAAYKRATLLLQQPDRLHALLSSEERPVQLVFAGKAHPSDQQGKEMIREVVQFGKQRDVRHRIVFLEDYDIAVAQRLLAGCDVWLNTPRRPFEACGTSGMKAVLNGALHCSIRDGWWDEMFDGDNGFAIASAETYGDIDWRDRVEASGLFDLLERRIVPLFYERDDGIPHEWLARVRTSLRTLAPKVSAARMLRSYVTDLYEPAARHADSLAADGRRRARDLAAWKAKVRHAWPNVHVDAVSGDDPTAELGAARQVTAVVELDGLSPDDVQVQLAHGAVAPDDELRGPSIVPMVLSDKEGADRYCYTGTFECERAGRYGFAVRVMPWHADIASPAELGLVTWAP